MCVLSERGASPDIEAGAGALFTSLGTRARALHIEMEPVTPKNWSAALEALRVMLDDQGVRQCSFVAYGAVSHVVVGYYLEDPKAVRTLALINMTARPHPTSTTRFVDWLEQRLPLGLPLRIDSEGFDAKPMLHRLRCPTLLITTPHASSYLREQSQEISRRIPTAWHVALEHNEAEALTAMVLRFHEVPARCPQKSGLRRNSLPLE